jgi:hypothetical protein
MRQLETLGGYLFVASAAVFLLAQFGPIKGQLGQYKQYAEYGAIAGAGLWIVGKVT